MSTVSFDQTGSLALERKFLYNKIHQDVSRIENKPLEIKSNNEIRHQDSENK